MAFLLGNSSQHRRNSWVIRVSKLEQDIAAIVGHVALCGRLTAELRAHKPDSLMRLAHRTYMRSLSNLEQSAAPSDQIYELRKAA